MTANQLLGNSSYPQIAYSGYRTNSRGTEPTIQEIKDDLIALNARGYRVIRTYNVHYDFTANVLQAITELKADNSNFEMYVILGVWIECNGAWQHVLHHHEENLTQNTAEIEEAITLTNQYSDIVKVISVGNEAMQRESRFYFVAPAVVLKWVNHLQELKSNGQLDSDLWITSTDSWHVWSGTEPYQGNDLNSLINAVDYISVHTYPFHGSNGVNENLISWAVDVADTQYQSVKTYLTNIGVDKPVHIGETGWATKSSDGYAAVANEANQNAYYSAISGWGAQNNVSVCLFSAFDESWKIHWDVNHSENNFGIFNLDRTPKQAAL